MARGPLMAGLLVGIPHHQSRNILRRYSPTTFPHQPTPAFQDPYMVVDPDVAAPTSLISGNCFPLALCTNCRTLPLWARVCRPLCPGRVSKTLSKGDHTTPVSPSYQVRAR